MKYMLTTLLLFLFVACGGELPEDVSAPAVTEGPPTPIEWPTFDHAVSAADKSGKRILVDIYAPWCGWCRKMQADVYTNETLVQFVRENFEIGRLNLDDGETVHDFLDWQLTSQELGAALGAAGTPTTVFLEPDGTYIDRVPGYATLEAFGEIVRFIASGAYQNVPPRG